MADMATQPETVAAGVRYPLGAEGPLERWGRGLLHFVRRKPLGAFGGLLILVVLLTALLGGLAAPHGYDEIDLSQRFLRPSLSHPFGTDDQGRDILSRVIYGARTSVVVSFSAVAIATLLSTTIGMVSGYRAGRFDLFAQRFIDIWQAFPGLIFVVFVISIFGKGVPVLIVTLGLLLSAGASRVVRSATFAVCAHPYIDAARALGAGDLRILCYHVLPNVLPVVLVNLSVQVGAVILIESALSFLGFGVPPPFPSWGRMLQDAQRFMQSYPHLALFPGLAIALTVYGFNMLGDALRDVLDPRLRGGP